MVEAYRLESKVAEIPRIVIDHKVVAVARQSTVTVTRPTTKKDMSATS